MRNSLETRLGMFFAVTMIAAFLIFEMASGGKYFKGGYVVHGLFEDVQELKEGDPVKKAGVQIGQVEAISFQDAKVRVSLRIDEGQVLKTDSKARIEFIGLLGQNFVSVDFGSTAAPALSADAAIETEEQPDLSALMARLDNVASGIENITRSFSGDSIQNVLGPLTHFLEENNPKISEIFDNLQVVTGKMSDGEGTMGKILTDDELYTTAIDAVKKLEQTGDEMQLTLKEARSLFGDGKTSLSKAENALTELETTLTEARKVVQGIEQGKGTLGLLAKDEALYKETLSALVQMREILEKINSGQGSMGELVNDDSLIRNAKRTLQKVDKATEGLEDTGPLSILGTAVNRLF
jgi:phospholipid/cholesterol/gamma-HCH transport system substrate-binding protein